MSDRQQDPELRTRFAELKRLDASRAPSFADVMARAQAEALGLRCTGTLGVILRAKREQRIAAVAPVLALAQHRLPGGLPRP